MTLLTSLTSQASEPAAPTPRDIAAARAVQVVATVRRLESFMGPQRAARAGLRPLGDRELGSFAAAAPVEQGTTIRYVGATDDQVVLVDLAAGAVPPTMRLRAFDAAGRVLQREVRATFTRVATGVEVVATDVRSGQILFDRRYADAGAAIPRDPFCDLVTTGAGVIACIYVPEACPSQLVSPDTPVGWVVCTGSPNTPPGSEVILIDVLAACSTDSCGTNGDFYLTNETRGTRVVGGSVEWRFYYGEFATNPNNYQPGTDFDLYINDTGAVFPSLPTIAHEYNFVGEQQGPWWYSDRCYPVLGVTDSIVWFDADTEAFFVASRATKTVGPTINCPET